MRRKVKTPPPPKGLSAFSKARWKAILTEVAIDDATGLAIFEETLFALDRCRAARARIEKETMLLADRFGQPKPHPLLAVERDARAQFLAGLKALNIDLEPLKNAGRLGGR